MIFLLLLFLPVLIAVGFFLLGGKQLVWQEFLIQILAQILVAGISVWVIYWHNTSDTEVWNGVVSGKSRDEVSCRHSYSCNCVEICSSTGKTTSCNEVCQTCYEHNYDVDWSYTTTDNGHNTIYTIDRQGIYEPPRWHSIVVGEASSSTHSYTNYIKASEGTLFKSQGLTEKYKDQLPDYPNKIYDYYRINRVVLVNGAVVDSAYNGLLSNINAELGHAKQVNIVLVFVKDLPQEYYYALEQHWVGGKKNDFVVVAGINAEQSIKWATIMAWVDNDLVKIKARDDLMALGNVKDPNAFIGVVKQDVSSLYVRKPMKDFSYLQASITPSTTELIVSMLIGVLVSVGLGFVFLFNDFFE